MLYYKVEITYPNGEIEEVDEDFLTVKKAQESALHLLGQVEYNAQFHKNGARPARPACARNQPPH